MLGLVVHADDFGLSEPVNHGIARAHRDGILTSTSLMAGGAAFEHAVAISRATPTLDLGVHLTLVEERPVLPAAELPSLVDATGKFPHHATAFTRRYFQGRVNHEEVRRELRAQIEKVLAQGIRVSHLDSHQHVHMLPEILRITVDLARDYGIAGVRFPAESVRPYMLRGGAGGAMRLAQLGVLRMFCRLGRHARVARPDYFADFFYGGKLDKPHLLEVLAHLPDAGTCELMCHPGLDDPHTAYGHWRYQWSRELDALTDPEIGAALRTRGVQLISHREIGQGRN